jgi:multisubunit Na+/H+ antiporter MnhF subunit
LAALAAALVPLAAVAALGPPLDGLVAVEAAGLDAALAMLMLAEGTKSQSFATLALVLAVASFIGSIAFVRFLERLGASGGQRR